MHDSLHITDLRALQVLDSRGRLTVHVRLRLADGTVTEATAPSGASTGHHEAMELRDGGPAYGGRGVTRAVANATGPIADLLTHSRWEDLDHLDRALCNLDGTYSRTPIARWPMLSKAYSMRQTGLSTH